MKIFELEYSWESLADLERDVSEAVQGTYNPKAKAAGLDGEFEGTIKVTIEYIK